MASKENSLSQIDEEDNFSNLNWKMHSQTIDKKEGNLKKMKEIKLSVASARKKKNEDEEIDDEEKKNDENKKSKKEMKQEIIILIFK